MKTYFITGTGTGIGKTFSTGVLAKDASEKGAMTAVMKPVQTGLTKPEDGDIGQVARMAPMALNLESGLACPYCLKFEASPHLAAKKEQVTIDFDVIRETVDIVGMKYDPDLLLLEGAGGLLVPIDEERMMIDLIQTLGYPVILVATAGLGTINHTLLSIHELRGRQIPIAGYVVNLIPRESSEIEEDNIRMLEKLAGVPCLGKIWVSSESEPVYEVESLI